MRNQSTISGIQAGPGEARRRCLAAVEAFRRGQGVVLLDDADRENEADLIFPARTMTEAQMALMIRECSGIVCLCLEPAAADRLDLPPMVERNQSRQGTAFTVSIEAREGVTTGVSSRDRIATIQAAVAPGARAGDLVRPGHVFPLRAHPLGCWAGGATRKAAWTWPASRGRGPWRCSANS
jgi:3,4-dihydroxy 2-butanone 4-phosphate synthase